MLRGLFQRVADAFSATSEAEAGSETRETAIRLATAILLVEVARADNDLASTESTRIEELVRAHFGLSTEDARELAERADEESGLLVSLHQFTQLLHDELDDEEKAGIVRLLWDVAYADGRLDKFEDTLVLRISDLLYVSRGIVMRLKHDADPANGTDQGDPV